MNEVQLLALGYHKQGFAIIPVPRGSKAPKSDWRTITYDTPHSIPDDFENVNIGVKLGVASNNLVDIDLDEPIAAAVADILMPDTRIFGRKSKPRSHRLYRLTDWSMPTKKYYDPMTRTTLIEIRCDGAQTIFPGSIHSVTKETIEWENPDATIVDVTREQLREYVNRVASATLLAKYWGSGSRHDTTLALAGWFIRNGLGKDEILSFVSAVCVAAKDTEQRDRLSAVSTSVNRHEDGENVSGLPSLIEIIDERIPRAISKWMGLFQRSAEEQLTTACTDEGNVDRFIAQHKDILRWVAKAEAWYIWNGKIWERDSKLKVTRLAAETGKSIYAEASAAETAGEREDLARWAIQSNMLPRCDAMIKKAKGRQEITVDILDLDVNPDLLTVQNGTVDMTTGTLLAFDKDHLITKMANVIHDGSAPEPYLVRMVESAVSDASMLRNLQKALGLALTANTEKVIFFCYGPTDTGKTTFLTQGMYEMLGDYARQMSLDYIVKNTGQASAMWAADMHNIRMGLASELPRDFPLNVASIKAMTGDSILKARALYAMPFDSKPIATIFVDTNYRPEIGDGDDAIWNRVQLVHFRNPVKRVPGEVGYVPDFKKVIKEPREMSGLLNWCIEGYISLKNDGWTASESMEAEKADYREEQDIVGEWLRENIEAIEDAQTSAPELFAAFDRWQKDQSIAITVRHSKFAFNDAVSRMYDIKPSVAKINKKSIRVWKGIQFNAQMFGESVDGGTKTFVPHHEEADTSTSSQN